MNKTIIATIVGFLFSNTQAAELIELEQTTIKANRFERQDTETTYASEVHTANEIEASGAVTLYEFLSQQSSVNIGSYFGNKATPTLELRGYGATNGNQNVVIMVDGQRLNNIDSSPQLISAIPLSNIDRIEITKGSGSVIYGDGATAGTIQIYTKNKTGITAITSFGNYGQKNYSVNAGISEQYFDLSASLSHDSADGYNAKDKTGHRDELNSDTQHAQLKIKPIDNLRIMAGGTNSRSDIRYPNALTKSQFDNDPFQNGKPSTSYTHQGLYSEVWNIGVEYDITPSLTLAANHVNEDKISNYLSSSFKYDFLYKSNDIALKFNNEQISAVAGLQTFDGTRNSGDTSITSKDSRAEFINAEYRPTWLTDALTLSAGYRGEIVKYQYAPSSGATLNDSHHLTAWDIGANYRFSQALTAFANLNKAYLSPNIDNFFGFDASFNTIFNGFIKPQESKTLNLGLNHVVANNRLKATVFYADLTNEFYYDKSITSNAIDTNIDESHKYGLELQDYFKFNNAVSASILYNYTRSIIDKEVLSSGVNINNKELPSAPKHGIVANLNYQFMEHANINLNQVWRSSTYAAEDFTNSATQKQGHYESTNLSANYQYKNLQFFTAVTNLFEHANSIQIRNDSIYPIDFARTFRIGMKADF